jgi:hypothetical protein
MLRCVVWAVTGTATTSGANDVAKSVIGILGVVAGVVTGAWLTSWFQWRGRLHDRLLRHLDTVLTELARHESVFFDRLAGIDSRVSSSEELSLRAALLAVRDPDLDKAVAAYTSGMTWYVDQRMKPPGQGTTVDAEERGRAAAELALKTALDRLATIEARGVRRKR